MLQRSWCFASKLRLHGLEKMCLNHMPLTCVLGKRQTMRTQCIKATETMSSHTCQSLLRQINIDVCLYPDWGGPTLGVRFRLPISTLEVALSKCMFFTWVPGILLGIALWSHGTGAQIQTQNKPLVCLNCKPAKTAVTPVKPNSIE